MGKDGHYTQQALKHVQQVHQVSVHVTNNVINLPIDNLACFPPKTIPTYNQKSTLTHCKLKSD